MPDATKIQVHRFHDRVAVSFSPFRPDLPTYYITTKMADELVTALQSCMNDIKAASFDRSRFPTTMIDPNEDPRDVYGRP